MHGNVTEYTYYNDDRLREVIIKRTGQSDRVFTYSYDAAGRLSEIVYPTSTGIKAVFDDGATPTPNPGWNENGQLTHLRYLKKDGQGVYQHFHSFEYEYDPSGNRKKFIDTPENTANKITWEYSYDWLNRLTEVKRGDGAATPTTQRVYAYDESDNRTFLDDHVNNLSLHYTYDVADQILEIRQGTLSSRDTVNDFSTVVESFTHNDDGMMTTRTVDPNGTPVTTDYTWDEFDRLVELERPAGILTNSYDTDGIRKHRLAPDGSTLDSFHSGLPTINETHDPSVGSPTVFSYLLGHRLLGFEKQTDFFYFVTDGLTSVRLLVSEAGAEAASYVYDEAGARVATSENSGSSPKTYVGGLSVHDELETTGLYYMRQRWYDPTLTRFLRRDPIGFQGGLNLYAYVNNQPTNLVDPRGLDVNDPLLFSDIISREGWGAAPPGAGLAPESMPKQRITVHHQGPSGAYVPHTSSAEQAAVRWIQHEHMSQGYADIGYNFAIDRFGRIYSGRSLQYEAAHVHGANPGNVGIVLIGNYEGHGMTRDTMVSLCRLLKLLSKSYGIPLTRSYVMGHQEVLGLYGTGSPKHPKYDPESKTDCPGSGVQDNLTDLLLWCLGRR